jgi:hypothetical protein
MKNTLFSVAPKLCKTLSVLTALAFIAACGGGGSGSSDGASPVSTPTPTPTPAPNIAPIANAGPDQSLVAGATVTLDGSASSDGNGDALRYQWTISSAPVGSRATLTSPATVRPTIIPDVAGTYRFTLVVSDGNANSPSDEVTIVVSAQNISPVADAGVDQNVLIGAKVTLDGSASTDANGDALTYQWTLETLTTPADTLARLSDPTAVKPTFTADRGGLYYATLVVSDGQLSSAMDTVVVLASLGNAAPVANAGVDQEVKTGTVVTLDGSASADANGDSLTLQWTLAGAPAGSAAVLSNSTAAKPTFLADRAGTYTVDLVVNDGQSSSAPDTVTIVATDDNVRPTANAGMDQNVVIGAAVALDGSASVDPNGDVLSYQWSLTAVPTGSTAALSSAIAMIPTFTADLEGVYVASLVVNDGKESSNIDTVTVTAARANAAPTAKAGADQSVYQNTTVDLDGSESTDPDGDPITYRWTAKTYPGFFAPTLSDNASAKPRFWATAAGDYVFELTVSDGVLDSAADSVTVSVLKGAGPTPAGTELVVGNGNNVFVIREQTMTKYVDFSCGGQFMSLDQLPDGTLIGNTISQLYEINALTGACVARGNTPEWLMSVAASPTGELYGVSFNQYEDQPGVRTKRLYRLSSSGASEGFVGLSGATRYVNGMDFGPDGVLYGTAIANAGQWWIVSIDPQTGVTELVTQITPKPDGDIDIDGNFVLRGISFDSLLKFDLIGKTMLSTVMIPGFNGGSSAISPVVYVP